MALSTAVFVGESRNWIPDLVKKVQKLKVGPGWKSEIDIGPVISEQAKQRILSLINSAKNEGAKILLDGSNVVVNGFEKGYFVGATILSNVKPKMKCYKVYKILLKKIIYLLLFLGRNFWSSSLYFRSEYFR